MRPRDMHRLAHSGTHDSASPKGWHQVPKVTGDYDLDATIEHRSNRDMPHRLALYTKGGRVNAYGYKTGYRGYHGYGGDD